MRSFMFSVSVVLKNGKRVEGVMTGRGYAEVRQAVRDTVEGRDARSVTLARLG